MTDDVTDRIIGALVSDPEVGRAAVRVQDDGSTEVRLYDAELRHRRTAILTPCGEGAVDLTWKV